MSMKRFDLEMQNLNLDIIRLGSLIEEALNNTVKALSEQNETIAEEVIKNDKSVNALSSQIESEALKILLIEHPVASDLRAVSTALKMVTDMERIGDQARDICEIVLLLSEKKGYKTSIKIILQMAAITTDMVKNCVDAFVKKDVDLSQNVIETDNAVDKLFYKMRDSMVDFIKTGSEDADQAIYLMMIAKYFEKIGDHAENIAEWVQFHETGERKNIKLI